MSTQRVTHINPAQSLLLAYCANEAYYPERHKAPEGYTYIGNWLGKNPSILGGNIETYGLVFRGITPTTSDDYIFAFKGTSSFWDAYEDVFINKIPFQFYQDPAPSKDIMVASGFGSVYATSTGEKGSMQDQLFKYIEALKPRKVTITGHSLGSALAELFTLDLYHHQRHLNIEIAINHYNFACPRVGNEAFANTYNLYESYVPEANRTVRIVNYWDLIPCVPFEVLGYYHTASYFLISFYKKDEWIPHYVVRHSIFNYWQVLKKVMETPQQEYKGDVTGLDNVVLMSTILSASQTECTGVMEKQIASQMKELQEQSH